MATGRPQRSAELGEDTEETGRERLPHSLPSGQTSVCCVPRRGWGSLQQQQCPSASEFLFILSPLCPELPFTLSNSLAITFLSPQAERGNLLKKRTARSMRKKKKSYRKNKYGILRSLKSGTIDCGFEAPSLIQWL